MNALLNEINKRKKKNKITYILCRFLFRINQFTNNDFIALWEPLRLIRLIKIVRHYCAYCTLIGNLWSCLCYKDTWMSYWAARSNDLKCGDPQQLTKMSDSTSGHSDNIVSVNCWVRLLWRRNHFMFSQRYSAFVVLCLNFLSQLAYRRCSSIALTRSNFLKYVLFANASAKRYLAALATSGHVLWFFLFAFRLCGFLLLFESTLGFNYPSLRWWVIGGLRSVPQGLRINLGRNDQEFGTD